MPECLRSVSGIQMDNKQIVLMVGWIPANDLREHSPRKWGLRAPTAGAV
jgi:hypothetical protein